MTDVPPGNEVPGNDPDPYVPTGTRRSTYTPPEEGVEPPAFDDDALAAAMAAEVAAYTSPITVLPPAWAPAEAAEPAPTPVEPVPVEPVPVEPVPAEPVPMEAGPVEAPPAEPAPAEASTSSTLDAIQRLEDELRRRAESASDPIDLPAEPPAAPPPLDFAPGAPVADRPFPDSPLFPSPPTFIRSAPPESAPVDLPAAPTGFGPPISEPAILPDPPTFETPTFDVPTFAPQASEPPTFELPTPEVPPFEAPIFVPPSYEPPAAFGPPPDEPAPLDPPFWDSAPPPVFAPPPLVEPPVPSTGSIPVFSPPPSTPAFGMPPVTPAVDLPPPGMGAAADLAHLPPPIGLEPAAIPPYDPIRDAGVVVAPGALAPPPADFEALLGVTSTAHPDDLDPADFDRADLDVADLDVGDFPPPESPYITPTPVGLQSTEDDDVVDEVDRAFGTGAIVVDSTGSVAIIHPPSEPIATVRLADDEAALVDDRVESHPALVVESAGAEPTALDLRAGRAARLFWLWFAANSSVISLSLGAVLFGLGMSLRQTLIAIVVGIAISFLPLGLVTLAGKWSGQPTMVVSRATFGLAGNALPALIAVISRVFWGGALLWVLATGVAQVLVDSGLDAGLGQGVWTFVGLGVGFLLTFVVAIFGYGLIARVQLVLSILTGLLVVGVIAITSSRLDLAAAQLANDGPWILVVTGVVLVFSFVGLAWVHSSGDIARYQRTSADGGSTMLWATFGATLPAFLLIAWGALLAASDPLIADGLATNPLHTIAALLPIWYPAPLIAALALGLLSGVVLTMYSGGFALQSLGIRTRRSVTTVIAGILVLAVAFGLLFVAVDVRGLIRDVVTTLAVPVAAWAGIFGAEIMIRRRGFDSHALLSRGGVYPAVRWVNLIGLIVITALGFGLTTAVLPGLDWQGYLFPLLGFGPAAGGADNPLLSSDVGVLVALVLGILLPLITAVPAIRRQERALGDDAIRDDALGHDRGAP